MARGEEADMFVEFCEADEGRERADFPIHDPRARGAVSAERDFELIGVRGEKERQERLDLSVGKEIFSPVKDVV